MCLKMNSTMIEVEIKLPIKDENKIVNKLIDMGYQECSYVQEIDSYYDSHDNAIRKHDKAMRIRKVIDLNSMEENSLFTFKGKKKDTITMSRDEYETEISSADNMDKILAELGYYVVKPQVIKLRREYVKDSVHACVDKVENLGDFLELEILAETEEEKANAVECIQKILAQLGHSMEETTRVSYLTQLQNMRNI